MFVFFCLLWIWFILVLSLQTFCDLWLLFVVFVFSFLFGLFCCLLACLDLVGFCLVVCDCLCIRWIGCFCLWRFGFVFILLVFCVCLCFDLLFINSVVVDLLDLYCYILLFLFCFCFSLLVYGVTVLLSILF